MRLTCVQKYLNPPTPFCSFWLGNFFSKKNYSSRPHKIEDACCFYTNMSEDFSPKVLTDPFVLQVGKPRLRVFAMTEYACRNTNFNSPQKCSNNIK